MLDIRDLGTASVVLNVIDHTVEGEGGRLTYAVIGFLCFAFLLYVWSNTVIKNVMCSSCDMRLGQIDRMFGPVHVCAHLKVKETDDADV